MAIDSSAWSLFGYDSIEECRIEEIKECSNAKCVKAAEEYCDVEFLGECGVCMKKVSESAIEYSSRNTGKLPTSKQLRRLVNSTCQRVCAN